MKRCICTFLLFYGVVGGDQIDLVLPARKTSSTGVRGASSPRLKINNISSKYGFHHSEPYLDNTRSLELKSAEKISNNDLSAFLEKWKSDTHHEGTKHYRSAESRVVEYGGGHPFEILAKGRRLEEEGVFLSEEEHEEFYAIRRLQESPWRDDSIYRPIRITVETSFLDYESEQYYNKIKMVREDALPRVQEFWNKALRVFPAKNPILVDTEVCPVSKYLSKPLYMSDTDLVIIVAANSDMLCSHGSLAAARSCQADQYDKPTVGNAVICLDQIDDTDKESSDTLFNVLIHEFAHVLGMRALDLAYFYNPETGIPRTPRPLQDQSIKCVDGNVVSTKVPSTDTIQSGFTKRGNRYFQVVTPTVKQVVRNQFDCDRVEGARLENQPTNNGNCFGTHWEARLFVTDLMSAISTPVRQVLSPLTLALFEDSGWYKADYSVSESSPFGQASGCDFVYEDCIQNGEVPEWGKAWFCNDFLMDTAQLRCGMQHKHIVRCDLVDFIDYPNAIPPKPSYQYFPSHPTWGGLMHTADYCPLNLMTVTGTNSNGLFKFSCDDESLESSVVGEFFGSNSRCYDTNLSRSICLKTECDENLTRVKILVKDGDSFIPIICENDGDIINLPGVDRATIICPQLGIICPKLMCPANCRGRGVCDHSRNPSKCICFNPLDETDDCSLSGVGSDINPEGEFPDLNGNYYCGISIYDAQSCRTSQKCPGGSDNECDDSQKCFNVETCNENPGPENLCGVSITSAMSCNGQAIECPGGSNDECPDGETCYSDVSCMDDEKNKMKMCGFSRPQASLCGAQSRCPSGSDDECPRGEKCYHDVVCSVTTPYDSLDNINDEGQKEDDEIQNQFYCASSYVEASKCTNGTACPSKESTECDPGEFCFRVLTCEAVEEDAFNVDWRCGDTLESASKCFKSIACPNKTDRDCPRGQSCFSVEQCEKEQEVDEGDQFEWYCGKNYPEAAKCLSGCPSKTSVECRSGDTCFPVISCEPFDEDDVDWHCGETSEAAAKCFDGSSCPSRKDEDCPAGQSCFPVVSCEGEQSLVEEDQFEWHCGKTYPEAAKCLSDCPSKVDGDCLFGETCFPVTSCEAIDDNDFEWYCGDTFEIAASCIEDSVCSGKLNGDCPPGQSCFPVVSCESEQGIDELDRFEWHCGKNYFEANQCLSKCSNKDSSDCLIDESCFPITSCNSIDWHCGETSEIAVKCLEGSSCSNEVDNDDCPTGQSCFPVVTCENEQGGDEVDRFEWHCGKNYPEAAQCVSDCPSTENSDCPIGETCYPVLSCEPIDESYVGWYCGETSDIAAQCEEGFSCPSTLDSDCPTGQSCHPVVSCISEEGLQLWHCGKSYTEASRCMSDCPTRQDLDCPPGEYCFPVKSCGLTTIYHFCGSSLADASRCRSDSVCPGRQDNECPLGEKCFNVVDCMGVNGDDSPSEYIAMSDAPSISNAPSVEPTPIPRRVEGYNMLLCIEHGILDPVFIVRKTTSEVLSNILTNLFQDEVVLAENIWNITESQFRVHSAETRWLEYSPEILDCVCKEGDSISSCSSFNTTVDISLWERLHHAKSRYLTFVFFQSAFAQMPHTRSWGYAPISSHTYMSLSGLPISDIPFDSKEFLQKTILDLFNKYVQSRKISNLLALIVDAFPIDGIPSKGLPHTRSLEITNNVTLTPDVDEMQTVTFRFFFAAQYLPPLETDFDSILSDFMNDNASSIVTELAKSEESYFAGITTPTQDLTDITTPTLSTGKLSTTPTLSPDKDTDSTTPTLSTDKALTDDGMPATIEFPSDDGSNMDDNIDGSTLSSISSQEEPGGNTDGGPSVPPVDASEDETDDVRTDGSSEDISGDDSNALGKSNIGLRVGLGIVAVLLVAGFVVMAVICVRKKRKSNKASEDDTESFDDIYRTSDTIPASTNAISLFSPGDVTSVITDPTYRGGAYAHDTPRKYTALESLEEDKRYFPSRNTDNTQLSNVSESLLSYEYGQKNALLSRRVDTKVQQDYDFKTEKKMVEDSSLMGLSIVQFESPDDVSALMTSKGVEDILSMDRTVETHRVTTQGSEDPDNDEEKHDLALPSEFEETSINSNVDKNENGKLNLVSSSYPCNVGQSLGGGESSETDVNISESEINAETTLSMHEEAYLQPACENLCDSSIPGNSKLSQSYASSTINTPEDRISSVSDAHEAKVSDVSIQTPGFPFHNGENMDFIESSHESEEGSLSEVRHGIDKFSIVEESSLEPSVNNNVLVPEECIFSEESQNSEILNNDTVANPQEIYPAPMHSNPSDTLVESKGSLITKNPEACTTTELYADEVQMNGIVTQTFNSNSTDRIIENGATLSWLGATYDDSVALLDVQSTTTAEERGDH